MTAEAGSRPTADPAHASVLMFEAGGRGGVTDYTQQLVEALSSQGRQVDLVTARDHLYRLPPGVTVHPIVLWVRDRAPVGRLLRRAGLGRLVNAVAFIAVLPQIARLARRRDVVHVQGHYFPPLSALLALAVRIVRRPLITTAHNTFDRGRTYARSHRIMAAASGTTIVHTRADEERLRDRPGDVIVIPHGEYGGLARTGGDADRGAARADLGVRDDEFVALMFGQLRADKGIGDLLAAAEEVPDVRVILAGEDVGGLAEVSEPLARLGDRVILQEGFLPMSTAARLFAAADVVVLPYQVASQSGVLLLAYGFERAVIAYPVGGLAESIEDGRTGWLTSAPTPAALADALRSARSAGHEECARRGVAGRRLSDERYSWAAIAERTAELYDDRSGQTSLPAS